MAQIHDSAAVSHVQHEQQPWRIITEILDFFYFQL